MRRISLDPVAQTLDIDGAGCNCSIGPQALLSVYYRAPTYLRDTYQPRLTPDEQFSRSQWAAFVRSLVSLKVTTWMNHPQATYLAEMKPYQLGLASRIGFRVPHTLVTNSPTHAQAIGRNGTVVIKTLDAGVLKVGSREAFIYTNAIPLEELKDDDMRSAPAIVQTELEPKLDIRVTVVDGAVLAVEINRDGQAVKGDWRLQKSGLTFAPHHLPSGIEGLCSRLVRELGLAFGAIDLALHNGEYFFLEINPTGEWGWLQDAAGLDIDSPLVAALTRGD